MANTQDILRESTRVAKEAANQIGGSFEQGVGFKKDVINKNITADDLNEQPNFKIRDIAPATEAAGASGALEALVKQSYNSAQQNFQQSRADYIQEVLGPGETELTADLYSQEGGVDDTQVQLDDITSQIEAEQHALRRQLERLQKNPQGLFGGALEDKMADVERESLQKQADLSVIQLGIQRRFDSAKAIADRAVAVAMEKQGRRLEARKIQYQDNRDLFDKAEQRQMNLLLKQEEREYESERAKLQDISDLSMVALKNGAPMSVVLNMRGSNSVDEALSIGKSYMVAPKVAAPPTIKEINGKSMQWDAQAGVWKPVEVSGAASETQETRDQLTFLRDTIEKARELSSAAGPSYITKKAGDLFVGDSKFRQLEQYTNTLKTNVLTLMSDPTIRQFFGPQMSEADVRMMTSAGTSLDAQANSPESLKTELVRLDNLLNRMETSIDTTAMQGGEVSTNTVTAPDGTQVEIID